MKKTTTPTLFDDQRTPALGWPTQGNPLFESRAPLPLQRATSVHHVHCIHYAPHQDTRFCPDCRFNDCCRAARKRGLAPCP